MYLLADLTPKFSTLNFVIGSQQIKHSLCVIG